MTEFGDIFDYQESAMCLECLNLGFMAIYGLAIVWIVAVRKNPIFNRLRTFSQSS